MFQELLWKGFLVNYSCFSYHVLKYCVYVGKCLIAVDYFSVNYISSHLKDRQLLKALKRSCIITYEHIKSD